MPQRAPPEREPSRVGIDPRSIIAVGDTEYDAQSAGKAGLSTIGLLCGGSSPAKLKAAGCIALYRDPADLLKNYDTSPLARLGTRPGSLDNNKEKSMSLSNALYFLTGLGVGVAAALLYAPKSGSETRDFLRSKSDEGTRYVKQAAGDAAELAKHKTGDLKKTAADSIERGKQAMKAPLENLSSAVEAGKKAYQEKSAGTELAT